jgi:hypothetical protein
MEIGLPNTAVGVTTSTGLNQGYAQVLDKSTFDPIGFLENFNKAMLQKQEAEAKKQLELRNKWGKIATPDIETINIYNNDEIMGAANQLEDLVAELATQGVDPDSPEAQKAVGEVTRRIQYLSGMGKDVATMLPKRFEQAKNFPPEQWNKYVEGLEKQPTIEDRYKYVTGNNPFKKPFDELAFIKRFTPADKILESALGGNETLKTVFKDEKDIRQLFNEQLVSPDPIVRDEVQEWFNDGIESGAWKDAAGMEQYYVDKVKAMFPEQKTREGARIISRGTTINNNNNGGIAEGVFGDVTVIPSGLSTDAKIQAINDPEALKKMTPDQISQTALRSVEGFPAQHGIYNLTYKDNTQFKEGNFTSLDGGSVKGKPSQIYYSEDGSLWAVLGDERVPLALNPEYIKDNELIKRAKANQRALAESFNYANFEEVLTYIRGAKSGKGAAAMKMNDGKGGTTNTTSNTLTTGSLDGL